MYVWSVRADALAGAYLVFFFATIICLDLCAAKPNRDGIDSGIECLGVTVQGDHATPLFPRRRESKLLADRGV
jgi:hypothetical protein